MNETVLPLGSRLASELLENGTFDTSDYLLIETLCKLARHPLDETLWQGLTAMALALKQGHVRFPLSQPAIQEFVLKLEQGAYTELVGNPGDYKPLIRDGDFLYVQRLHVAETEVASRLRRLLSVGSGVTSHPEVASPLASLFEHILLSAPLPGRQGRAMEFTPEQRRALEASFASPLLAISGGPGTGKTSLCANLLRAHLRYYGSQLRIGLAAPTGRAAQRLTESLRKSLLALPSPESEDLRAAELEAVTLHRLLDYDPHGGRFRRDENWMLDLDLLIVDEMSMVDLILFRSLLRALSPDTRLILLGDKDQLPSVEAGSVFADLGPEEALVSTEGPSAVLPWVTLMGSHRSGVELMRLAQSILRGDSPAWPQADSLDLKPDFSGAAWLPFDHQKEKAGWEGVLRHWILSHALTVDLLNSLSKLPLESQTAFPQMLGSDHPAAILLNQAFSAMDKNRMLAVLRRGPLGVTGLNQMAYRLLHTPDAREYLWTCGGQNERFFHGAPVLLQRNDAARDLSNGDVGLTLEVNGHFYVALPKPQGYALWPLASLPEPTLAFAITVHKSQGSEYDHVLLVLPEAQHPLLTREIVYTAMTRARHAAWILGSRAALDGAMTPSLRRHSGLKSRLAV